MEQSIFKLAAWLYTAISRNVVGKKALHKPIPKDSMGRSIELLHVLNTNET